VPYTNYEYAYAYYMNTALLPTFLNSLSTAQSPGFFCALGKTGIYTTDTNFYTSSVMTTEFTSTTILQSNGLQFAYAEAYDLCNEADNSGMNALNSTDTIND
jgi:hypothetical protein